MGGGSHGRSGTRELFVGDYACLARNQAGEVLGLGSGLESLLELDGPPGEPQRLAQLDGFARFAIGESHALAWTDDGLLHGFGEASWGVLGNGVSTEQEFCPPTPIEGAEHTVVAAAANDHSLAIFAER